MLKKKVLLFNAAFIVIALLLASWYKYNIDQDQISYISIAEKYLNGNFKDAVNGIWSPLLSWLLIPFLAVGAEPVFAFKIVQLSAGLFTFNIFLLFLQEYQNDWIYYLGGTAAAVILMSSAYLTGTPDLLMGGLLLSYLYVITTKNFFTGRSQFLIAGVIAAIAYYTKAYALPFFLLHFTVVMGYNFFRHKELRSKIVKGYLTAVITFLLLSLPWITSLSIKYDHLTYSTAGRFNFAVVGPEYNNVHHFRMQGLIPPVNETAVSYWEDPTYLNYKTWSPFNSSEEFRHLVGVIINNILRLLFFFFTYSPLLIILFIIPGNKKDAGAFLLTIALYSSGLLLLFIEQRFLIFPHLLLLLASFYLAFSLSDKFSRSAKFILYALIFLSVLARPAYTMLNNIDNNKDLFYISKQLDGKINGNIASYSPGMLDKNWGHSLFLSYSVGGKYYGEVPPGSLSDTGNELEEHRINYFLVWIDRDKFIGASFIREEYNFQVSEGESLIDIEFFNALISGIYKTFNLSRPEKEVKNLTVYRVVL
jgi:hypothetical protein